MESRYKWMKKTGLRYFIVEGTGGGRYVERRKNGRCGEGGEMEIEGRRGEGDMNQR